MARSSTGLQDCSSGVPFVVLSFLTFLLFFWGSKQPKIGPKSILELLSTCLGQGFCIRTIVGDRTD